MKDNTGKKERLIITSRSFRLHGAHINYLSASVETNCPAWRTYFFRLIPIVLGHWGQHAIRRGSCKFDRSIFGILFSPYHQRSTLCIVCKKYVDQKNKSLIVHTLLNGKLMRTFSRKYTSTILLSFRLTTSLRTETRICDYNNKQN